VYALVLLTSRGLRQSVGGFTQAIWTAGISSLALLPWALYASPLAIQANLIYLIPAGIISLGISTLLYFLALGRTRAQIVSVVAILEPVFGALIGVFFLGEFFTLPGLIGCVLVLGGIYLITR
jgi:drug/metabolite transporter (DMT)-like permease